MVDSASTRMRIKEEQEDSLVADLPPFVLEDVVATVLVISNRLTKVIIRCKVKTGATGEGAVNDSLV